MKRIGKFKLMIGAMLATFASPAMAGELLLNWGGAPSGKGRIFTDGTVSMRASAWSIGGLTFVDDESLGAWPEGLGVISGALDNSHTVDNFGRLDFLVLQFDQAVALGEATFNTGWNGMKDTDATIGYANFSTPFNAQPDMDNDLALFALKDFSLYTSEATKLGDSTRSVNPNGAVGNTWLIGASFIPKDKFFDSFKLGGITYQVQTPAVPEPATWMMFLLGFGAIGTMVRSSRSPAKRRAQLA
jgi:hypothetical protein